VTIGQQDKYDAKKLAEAQRDHSLYIAFAPAEAPQVALAVVVENAGFGSAHAAPIARRVFDYLLLGLYPSDEDILAAQKGLAYAPIGKQRLASEVGLQRVQDPTNNPNQADALLREGARIEKVEAASAVTANAAAVDDVGADNVVADDVATDGASGPGPVQPSTAQPAD
jgi:penicillin-binding protein 2